MSTTPNTAYSPDNDSISGLQPVQVREVTAYLTDGRAVQVPEDTAKSWQYEVANGDTTTGLAEWFTDHGEENTHAISGQIEDSTRCDHRGSPAEENTSEIPPGKQLSEVRVTNESQIDGYHSDLPHVSIWVCGRRRCVLDAMAFVERVAGERALWTIHLGDTDQWSSAAPTENVLASDSADADSHKPNEPKSELNNDD